MMPIRLGRCPVCGCVPRGKLTVASVAKSLGVDPRTVRRMIAEGKVDAERIPPKGAWRVYHHSLDALVRAGNSIEGGA